jgi:hypothetical protein
LGAVSESLAAQGRNPTRSPIPRRLGRSFAIALGLVAGLSVIAAPAHAADPGQVRRELYRQGDFVSQTNTVQCVGASMQMMLNMIRAQNDRTARTQLALQKLARANSPKRILPGGVEFTRPRRGASSFGWAAGLNKLGAGPYRVTSAPTMGGALNMAARAIRDTGRPVGLLVWHGSHAWVMSGFKATRRSDGDIRRVISVTVLDPWYPRYTPAHGASPRPGTRLTPRQLAADYLRWNRRRTSPFDGQYVLVLPYREAAPATAVAAPATPQPARFDRVVSRLRLLPV